MAALPEITEIVRHLLRTGDTDLSPTTRFDELTDWDSMDLISVVVEVECRYDLQFDLPEIDRLVTIEDLARMTEAKRMLALA